MIEIKYVCSNGEEYNLIGEKMRATSGYFHAYEWKPNTTEREMGVLHRLKRTHTILSPLQMDHRE